METQRAQIVIHVNLTFVMMTMFRFREEGTNTENTVSLLVACFSFPAAVGLFSAR